MLSINEVRSGGLRKWIQSAIYLPHFLSWVVIAGVFIALLSPGDGSVNQIAQSLGISLRTVEMHRGNMMDRLGASSLAEALTLALEAGIQPSTEKAQ